MSDAGRLGVVMLVHTALHRAEQVARHWTKAGAPVVIHVDLNVSAKRFSAFRAALSDCPLVMFSTRHRCEWGAWGLVAATQDAATHLLQRFESVRHVYLASGSCLPLRPVADLVGFLDRHPRTDFIESATTSDVPWTVDGLDRERFTLFFPFSWRRQRALFDSCVAVQRALGIRRRIPKGIRPHMGSQWWCLTRQTLTAILQDPRRREYDRYFRGVWIPDESYFQSLARLYSTRIESRSLTLSKFDYQGKPHIFYDDHLQLLRRSDCFVARKIWPRADRLYEAFLEEAPVDAPRQDPAPGKIDRLFAKAVERRRRGRAGLYMQSRFPRNGWTQAISATEYCVYHGLADLFEDFETWLQRSVDEPVHGALFDPKRAYFAEGLRVLPGALTNNAKLRDVNPQAFLTNFLWNLRGQRQHFQYGPRDNPKINARFADDPNARLFVISGAWALPLFQANRDFADIRAEAARLQKIENKMLTELRGGHVKARVQLWTLAEFVEAPMDGLKQILGDLGVQSDTHLAEAPRMRDLDGFGRFLQNLKNQGMHPYLTGDFPVGPPAPTPRNTARKPYLVRK